MRRRTSQIALGGILSGAAVALMAMGAAIPFSTFVTPVLASLCVLLFCVEYGPRAALLCYAAIAALALLMSADKEQALLFAFVLGYYPVLKSATEKMRLKWAGWLVKFVVFNVSVIAMYYVITQVLVVAVVRDEFAQYTLPFIIVLLVLGNVTLFIYDRALTRLAMWYVARLRPKLFRAR